MDEVLTIAEIEGRFESEWVLIEDPSTNEALEVRGGTVRCHGKDREESMNKMQRALSQFVVQGIHTTIPLHQKIFADAEFRAGQFDTKFMERFFERQKES